MLAFFVFAGHLAVVHKFQGHEMMPETSDSHLLDDNPNQPLLQNSADDDDDIMLDIQSKVTGYDIPSKVTGEGIPSKVTD